MLRGLGEARLAALCIVACVAAALLMSRSGSDDPTTTAPGPASNAPPAPALEPLTVAMLVEEATSLCRDALNDYEGKAAPCVLMGDLQEDLGDHTEAIKWWREGLRRAPGRADIYRRLARAVSANGEYEKAVILCRTARQIGLPPAGICEDMGSYLLELGKPREAAAALEEELRLHPTSVASYGLLAQAHSQLGQYEDAIANYEKMLSVSPRDKASYYGLATAYARLGHDDKARDCRETFTELRKQSDDAARARKQAYDDTARMREVVAGTHTQAGEIAHLSGRADEAERHYLRASLLDPGATLCREYLISLYIEQQRHEDALGVCRQLSELEPGNPRHNLNIGLILGNMNRFPEAAQALSQGIALAPNQPEGFSYLTSLLMRAGRCKEALVTAERLVALEPTGANYYVLSHVYEANGDMEGAREAIRRAGTLSPGEEDNRRAQLRLQSEATPASPGERE